MKQTKTKTGNILFLTCCAFLFLAGLFFQFAVVGYSFSALICFCLLGLLLVYKGLFLLARRYEKPARMALRILSVCVAVGVLIVSVTLGFVVNASFGQPDAEFTYLVVLGAGVHGTTPSLSLQNRLDAAYDYLTAHEDVICIVSGGQGEGEDITEAKCMFDILTARGIDESRIWMEDQATSTEENLDLSLKLIQARTGTRPTHIGLLSSEYHLLRATLFARDQGVTAYGIPAATTKISLRINYFLREVAGVWHKLLLGS